MRSVLLITIAILTIGLVAGPAAATTWTVNADGSGDFATIQAAIDGATNGDIIELEAATFTGAGNIGVDFKGKAVTVNGAGIGATVIDCESNDRGFKFVTNETSGSVLSNLTIRNGLSTDAGGGIAIQFSSPVIEAVKILDCEASHGGGIAVSEPTALPLIQGCEISGCVATDPGSLGFGGGGGLYVIKGMPQVFDCDIHDNQAANGGGVFLLGEGFSEVGGTYSGNLIHHNTATDGGGGLKILEGLSSLQFTDNLLYGNSAASGGGMFLNTVSDQASISSNTIAENTAQEGAGLTFGLGGAIVENTIFAFNTGSTNSVFCGGIAGAVVCAVVYNPGLDDEITCISSDIVNSNPAFCGELGTYNYELQLDSPATAANSVCGLIGAKDIGCADTPTRDTTWGAIKSMYRD